jgi:hypothetical protein
VTERTTYCEKHAPDGAFKMAANAWPFCNCAVCGFPSKFYTITTDGVAPEVDTLTMDLFA